MLTDLIFDFFGTLVEYDPGRLHGEERLPFAYLRSQGFPFEYQFVSLFVEEWNRGTVYPPGIEQFVTWLGSRYRLSILSNSHYPPVIHSNLRAMQIAPCFRSPPGSDQKPHPPPPPTEAHPPPTRPAKGDHTRSTSAFLPHSGQAGVVVRSFRCTKTSKVRSHRSHRYS